MPKTAAYSVVGPLTSNDIVPGAFIRAITDEEVVAAKLNADSRTGHSGSDSRTVKVPAELTTMG